jgi:hypothetical protein
MAGLQAFEEAVGQFQGSGFVSVEMHLPIGPGGAGSRLARIVQERGPAQAGFRGHLPKHLQGMGPDIVPVVTVLATADHRPEFGQPEVHQAAFGQQDQSAVGFAPPQQFVELREDPLHGDLAGHLQAQWDRGEGGGLHREPQLGREPAGAQRAETILREALERISHGPDQSGCQIPPASEGIHQVASAHRQGYGIDGEVAARQVLSQIDTQAHRFGPPAIQVAAVAAKSGHLHGTILEDHGHRAVLETRGDHPQARGLRPLHHGLGQQPGRQVPVRVRPPQELIPDCSADHHQLRIGAQNLLEPEQRAPGQSSPPASRLSASPSTRQVSQGRMTFAPWAS